jgi:hypothetical protein
MAVQATEEEIFRACVGSLAQVIARLCDGQRRDVAMSAISYAAGSVMLEQSNRKEALERVPRMNELITVAIEEIHRAIAPPSARLS